jgi:2-dehydropantoate 2-reductase
MKYKMGIIGAGAIGCFVGAHLIGEETEVFFLGREHFGKMIANSGLTITEHSGESFTIPAQKINWVTTPESLPILDLLIFTSKSHDTKKNAIEVQSHVHEKSIVLSLQNGLHNAEALKEIFPRNKIIGGMVPQNVIQVEESAHFKQSTAGHIYLGEEIPHAKNLPHEVTNELKAIQLGKLLKNLNNALNALSNIPLMEQLQKRSERKLLAEVVAEALAVMKANHLIPKSTGIFPVEFFPYALRLPNFLFNLVAASEIKSDPQARLSMWQDLELKRKTEIEFLNGEIVELAKKAGMRAEMNEKIIELIKRAERGELNSARNDYQKLLS